MKIKLGLVLIVLSLLVCQKAFALTTFQVYIDGAAGGDYGPDQDTWYSSANPFNLFVIGAYGPNTTGLSGVTLLVSVPNGETGTISFTNSGDGTPSLLDEIGEGSPNPNTNPTQNANADILTGNGDTTDGYTTREFLPADTNWNNHYPLQDSVSDFVIYSIANFGSSELNLSDYDGSTGIITSTSASGELKQYAVSYTGFSRLHFDVYGLERTTTGPNVRTTWDNNPGSHDATAGGAPVPEPATMSLMGLGLLGMVFRRKK